LFSCCGKERFHGFGDYKVCGEGNDLWRFFCGTDFLIERREEEETETGWNSVLEVFRSVDLQKEKSVGKMCSPCFNSCIP